MGNDINKEVKCISKDKSEYKAKIISFMKFPNKKLFKIKTKSGYEIEATPDHPILSSEGMKEVNKLNSGDKIVMLPFKGVDYEDPSSRFVITENDLLSLELRELRFNKIKEELTERDLLPLRYDSYKFPYLIKLAGYVLGDGMIQINKTNSEVAFYGTEKDLEEIKKEIEILGFKTGKIKIRERKSHITTAYRSYIIKGKEGSLRVYSSTLATLLKLLEIPVGNKTNQKFYVPSWVNKTIKWQKRLFLAAYFGAEMSSIKERIEARRNFNALHITITKDKKILSNGYVFLTQLKNILSEFGIEVLPITEGEEYHGKKFVSKALRLRLKNKEENILRFCENINYEYNKKRRFLANLAAFYIRSKLSIKQKREGIRKEAIKLYNGGLTPQKIISKFRGNINESFIKNSLYRNSKIKIPLEAGIPTFTSFVQNVKSSVLGNSGFIFDEINSITEIEGNYPVYDFTINETHNFIANNFVVSNCGMRLITTNLTIKEVEPKIKELVNTLFRYIPSGVGSKAYREGKDPFKLSTSQFRKMLQTGAKWCVEQGYGWEEDLERMELNGQAKEADESKVSDRAVKRGRDQVGTLGSGNHYLEIQEVKEKNIFDKEIAKRFGIFPSQVVIMYHCGSRGTGHQIATDYLRRFLPVMQSKYGIKVLDRELACAPFNSKEGQDYYKAMQCGINMAFANRQMILYRLREAFSKVFGKDAESLGMHMIYDVSHNKASRQKHKIDGEKKELILHLKGATSAFGPGREEIPKIWRDLSQPIIIGGDMESGSYLLVGTEEGSKTFYSTCHGAGRTMSRTKARKMVRGDKLQKDMERRGIYVKTASFSGLAEESTKAYKNLELVIDSVVKAGISKKVVKLIPRGNIKGNTSLGFLNLSWFLVVLIVLLTILI